MKKISIIIPVFNEEGNIASVHSALKGILPISDYDFEIIYVNDGSSDNSSQELEKIINEDSHVRLVEFSRNFGKEMATTAGINNCTGDLAILIDADLQHPVELIPNFVKKWESGAEVVIGVREKNKGEGLIKKVGSVIFYKIVNMIGDTKIMPRATDYRLLDRKVIDEFNRFTERNRMTRGLIDWLGFKKDYIYFQANERQGGEAGYSIKKLCKLALSTFTSFSLVPLKIAGYLGVIITLVSAILGIFILIEDIILRDPWGLGFSGTAMLAVMILFLVGIILICLGFIALYIANIHGEVTNRPMYVVRRNIGGKNEQK